MNNSLATYSFLPWLRQGIANNITSLDEDPAVKLRATIPIRLTVAGTKPDGSALADQIIDKDIAIYSPGDIIGIDSKVIIKTEPRNWITNFEPNYMAYVELYEEDFPWRYTPATPSGDRLRPWLCLVVLKEGEFEDAAGVNDNPLPFFRLKPETKAGKVFPKPSELWAWSHVHVNGDPSKDAAPNAASPNDVTKELSTIIEQNPDRAYSRILCPRKLEPNTGYYAFLIPSFESGRLAGLGRPFPTDSTTKQISLQATESAWDNDNKIEHPYYYRWYFRTGTVGDFEYLVNLLQPKSADKTVGVRDIDVLHPGSNLPPIEDPKLEGILKLGGALRVPFGSLQDKDKEEVRKYDEWDEANYPHPFTRAMALRINLEDSYTDPTSTIEELNKDAGITTKNGEGDPDPVITSPLYGRWHALQQRLLLDRTGNNLPHFKNWMHELNLDPRFRIAAGLGTQVVQKGQEEYMQAAWEQVGKIIEANNQIRFAQIATEASSKLYELHINTLSTEKAFLFTSPIHKRVLYRDLTVYKNVHESVIPPAITSGSFRKMIRPRGSIMKRLTFSKEIGVNNFIERINDGLVKVAPPVEDPEGAINLTDITKYVIPKSIYQVITNLFQRIKWLLYLALIFLLVVLIIIALIVNPIGPILLGVIILAVILSSLWLRKTISQDSQIPKAVDKYPKSPNFIITKPGTNFNPTKGSTDSEEATRFKAALKDAFTLISTRFPDHEWKKLEFTAITKHVVESINPRLTIPRRTFDILELPQHIRENLVEKFAPVMVHPEIDLAMYKPLVNISTELFLPNLNKIEPNSITLLENNQKFIESYMVGLNHEMSRELLWREYPTDQRGTYFRQFWDVHGFLSPQVYSIDDLKERYQRVLNKRKISNLYYYYSLLESSPTLDSELLNEAQVAISREELKDIVPINFWSKTDTSRIELSDPNSQSRNELGTHNQKAEISGKTQLVLVIRGELLKKYPTAVIYAQRADWGMKGKNGPKDVSEERVLVQLSDAESQDPPRNKLKTPLFEAKIEPDIYFFGFDLDAEEARGTIHPTSINDNPGWFFVLKERPGEPRFGLDIEKAKAEGGQERIINWNNLSWKDLETADGNCIELNKTITFNTYNNATDQENEPEPDDVQARWSPQTNAAELAYILYQVPVMVAVHASRMLPKPSE